MFIVLRSGEAWAPQGEDIVTQGKLSRPTLDMINNRMFCWYQITSDQIAFIQKKLASFFGFI